MQGNTTPTVQGGAHCYPLDFGEPRGCIRDVQVPAEVRGSEGPPPGVCSCRACAVTLRSGSGLRLPGQGPGSSVPHLPNVRQSSVGKAENAAGSGARGRAAVGYVLGSKPAGRCPASGLALAADCGNRARRPIRLEAGTRHGARAQT
jgi:hypothetical protein